MSFLLKSSYPLVVHFFTLFQPLLLPADLSKEEDTKQVVEATIKEYGQLNILVWMIVLENSLIDICKILSA